MTDIEQQIRDLKSRGVERLSEARSLDPGMPRYRAMKESRECFEQAERLRGILDGRAPVPDQSFDARLVREHAIQGCQCARCHAYRESI